MYFSSPEELSKIVPFSKGQWNREYLYEYLVWYANKRFRAYLDAYFQDYLDSGELADELFSFLLDDGYDGSDSQMSAAYLLSKMDRAVLRKKKDLLLLAQLNDVYWKRPFPQYESLEWLEDEPAAAEE